MPLAQSQISLALAEVADLYRRNLADHGARPEAVGWRDTASQTLRFERLVRVVEDDVLPSDGIIVNDLGSGYGAMFSYLSERYGPRLARYYGYDISDEMLHVAEKQAQDTRAVWIKSPRVTERADYSFVSGTFNVRLGANEIAWKEYVFETLVHLAQMSRRGFSFNLLTTYVDWEEEHLFYADPLVFFDFCKRNISPFVSLLHDYPLYEWTITVKMEDR
jgi:SAM-dependent methyltransferase